MTFISNDFEEINWAVKERKEEMKTQYLLSYIATQNTIGPIEPRAVEAIFDEDDFQGFVNNYKVLQTMTEIKDLKIAKRKVIFTEWERIEI